MEPISFLLGTFTDLVDRIINLEKSKIQDKQSLFDEIVHPLFEELEPVASNYIEIFRQAKRRISESSYEDLREIGLQIEDDRNTMLLGRIKVREMADQISENIKDENVVVFANSINKFFYRAADYPKRMSSHSRDLVSVFKSASIKKYGKSFLINYIDIITGEMEDSWASIVRNYEAIKIISKSPKKFIRTNRKETKSP